MMVDFDSLYTVLSTVLHASLAQVADVINCVRLAAVNTPTIVNQLGDLAVSANGCLEKVWRDGKIIESVSVTGVVSQGTSNKILPLLLESAELSLISLTVTFIPEGACCTRLIGSCLLGNDTDMKSPRGGVFNFVHW